MAFTFWWAASSEKTAAWEQAAKIRARTAEEIMV